MAIKHLYIEYRYRFMRQSMHPGFFRKSVAHNNMMTRVACVMCMQCDKTRNTVLEKKMKKAGIRTVIVSAEEFSEASKSESMKEKYELFFIDYKFVKERFYDIIKAVPDKEKAVVILNRFGFRENIKFFNNFKMLKFLVEPQVDYISALAKLFKSSNANNRI